MIGGGPQIRVNSCDQLFTRGQRVGRCRVIRRAEEAILAGTAISVRRMVAVVASRQAGQDHVNSEHFKTAMTWMPGVIATTPEIINVELPGDGW